MPTTPDPIADLLRKAPAVNAARADAWDAYQSAQSADDLSTALQNIRIPDATKNALRTLKAQSAPPQTWMEKHPNAAAIVKGGLNALPAAGAVAGGIVATPETLGGGTMLGSALGAGMGRGLRDLIAEHLGLDEPTDAMTKGAHIAIDSAVTAAIPGLITALKAPAQTLSEFTVFARQIPFLKAIIPDLGTLAAAKKIPVSVLTKPAWQTWEQYLPKDTPPAEVEKLKEVVPVIQKVIASAAPQVEVAQTATKAVAPVAKAVKAEVVNEDLEFGKALGRSLAKLARGK